MDNIDNLNFNFDQKELLQKLVPTLNAVQSGWLSGFLAAYGSTVSGGSAGAALATNIPLLIIYGSESGNSEGLAVKAGKLAKQKGFKSTVKDMFEITPEDLVGAPNLMVILSTWGEGDPPERATEFYNNLLATKAVNYADKVSYGVLALGDSSYVEFCGAAKKVDAKLEELGASRIIDRVDCDVDFEAPANDWIDNCINKFLEINNVKIDESTAPAAPTNSVIDITKFFGSKEYSPSEPFTAKISSKVLLNEVHSEKEVYHIEIDLEGSGINYKPGDSLGIVPENDENLVNAIIEKLGAKADDKVEGETIYDLLKKQYDITALTKPVIEAYAKLVDSKKLKEIAADKEKLVDYIYGRDLLDFITEHPAKDLSPEKLLPVLRKLPPRLYSISSAQSEVGDEVHLTIATVRYNSYGRDKKGVTSGLLADDLKEGDDIQIYLKPNKNFKLPENTDAPVIMVGPGTGIAPFRSFLQERSATGAKGKNWLFFGEQRFLYDFYYQTEFQDFKKSGVLTNFDAAFSRDKPQKVYVQHKMWEKRQELFEWLEQGAYFYVCGDEKRMAKDVDVMLHKIVNEVSEKGEDYANEYIQNLKKSERYLRDVY